MRKEMEEQIRKHDRRGKNMKRAGLDAKVKVNQYTIYIDIYIDIYSAYGSTLTIHQQPLNKLINILIGRVG